MLWSWCFKGHLISTHSFLQHAQCTSASGIMPILGKEGLIMNPVFNFHVPVPQLRLCDVGDPCCILLFSLPLNGLRAIACLSQWRFLWIAHLDFAGLVKCATWAGPEIGWCAGVSTDWPINCIFSSWACWVNNMARHSLHFGYTGGHHPVQYALISFISIMYDSKN